MGHTQDKRKNRKRAIAPSRRLAIPQILAWADAHHARTGRWPIKESGKILGGNGDKWITIDAALRAGSRGLGQGSSLARLLAKRRGVRNKAALPRFRIRDILAWADAYFRRQGKWPGRRSGSIPEAPGESWGFVEAALMHGLRGLKGGTTLPQLLALKRGARNHRQLPPLNHRQILAWADAFHRRMGKWPVGHRGPIKEAPKETWQGVAGAMQRGSRTLPALSLADLLTEKRGFRNHRKLPRLSYRKILAWADAWHQRTGTWPRTLSGPIPDAPGETWTAIGSAMQGGARGLPAGYSLPQLLSDRRGVRNIHGLPALPSNTILRWARRFRKIHGTWPHIHSGRIPEADYGETWLSVNTALSYGYRGLPGGSSLPRFLARKNGRTRPERRGHARRRRVKRG